MKNILFPTDFSNVSLNAFKFALEYATITNSKIIVFHAYDETAAVDPSIKEVYDLVDVENFQKKKDVFPPFEEIREQEKYHNVTIKYRVKEGEFIDTVMNYIDKKEDKINMVIIGTKPTVNRLQQMFVGRRTVKLLEDMAKPVIAVPEKSKFDGTLRNILFLVDYKEDEREPLEELIENSKEFNAKLHVVHFDLAHGESIVPMMENLKNSFRDHHMDNVVFKSVDSLDLKVSMRKYCAENEIDMVCLINHKKNFYQRLFTYSLSEDLISNLAMPVMALYRD